MPSKLLLESLDIYPVRLHLVSTEVTQTLDLIIDTGRLPRKIVRASRVSRVSSSGAYLAPAFEADLCFRFDFEVVNVSFSGTEGSESEFDC